MMVQFVLIRAPVHEDEIGRLPVVNTKKANGVVFHRHGMPVSLSAAPAFAASINSSHGAGRPLDIP